MMKDTSRKLNVIWIVFMVLSLFEENLLDPTSIIEITFTRTIKVHQKRLRLQMRTNLSTFSSNLII